MLVREKHQHRIGSTKRAQMRPPLARDSGKAARRAKRVAHVAKAATVAAGAAAAADTAAVTPQNDRAAT